MGQVEVGQEGGEDYYPANESDGVAEESSCEAGDEGGEVEGCVFGHFGSSVPVGTRQQQLMDLIERSWKHLK